MKYIYDYMSEYGKYLYFVWAVLILIRMWLNERVYDKQENATIKELNIPFAPKYESVIILIFVFWFNDYKTEKDKSILKLMKISDIFGVCVIIYTIAICALGIMYMHNR